jgi:hypothetical protein
MQKLINAYKADPSLDNARRLYRHDWKHAFASIMLSLDDQALLQQAIARHYKGV